MEETVPAPRENPWQRLRNAKRDEPTFYVATHFRWRWREEDAFWGVSAPMERHLWGTVSPQLPDHRIAIAIGSGIGRLAVPLGYRFTRVRVVSTSRMAAAQLRETCARFGVLNMEVADPATVWEEPAALICSILHFPHVREIATIANEIAIIARCLQGTAFLHFDTVPRTRVERLAEQLMRHPLAQDPGRRPSIYHRDADDIRALLVQHGLIISREFRPHSAQHVFVVSKA